MTDPAPMVGSRQSAAVPFTRYLVFVLVAAGGGCLDLMTKWLVFQWRGMPGEQPIWWLWEGVLGVETSLNTGALFGLGTDRVFVFAALSVVALVGVLVWFVYGRVGTDLGLTIVFGCIVAGILGNLYDRLGLWSIGESGRPAMFAVRDWIRVSYGQYVWPNFNIADSLLVCSAVYLLWHSFRNPVRSGPGVDRSPSAAARSASKTQAHAGSNGD